MELIQVDSKFTSILSIYLGLLGTCIGISVDDRLNSEYHYYIPM